MELLDAFVIFLVWFFLIKKWKIRWMQKEVLDQTASEKEITTDDRIPCWVNCDKALSCEDTVKASCNKDETLSRIFIVRDIKEI